MRKRGLSWLLIIIICFSMLSLPSVTTQAATLGFTWLQSDTLDDLLNVVDNKAGNDEILVQWDLDQNGSYTLTYRLEDNRYTEVTFNHQAEQVVVNYGIFEDDGTVLTEQEMLKSYQEMDYDAMVPSWVTVSGKTVEVDGTLSYVIEKKASAQYPGVSFNINNTTVKIKWNIQTDTMLFLTKGVEDGKIIPMTLEAPSTDVEALNILRNLESFQASPTHWVNKGSGNQNLQSIEMPSTDPLYEDETPGGRPGISLSFKQPQIYNEINHQFETAPSGTLDDINAVIGLGEVSSSAYIDFMIELDAASGAIVNAPNTGDDLGANTGVMYLYDSVTEMYTINIVKDKTGLSDQNEFVQWSNLEASRIYTVTMDFSEDEDYSFDTYLPDNQFGYTYIEYEVKRASMEEAYLEIVPYEGSDENELEYTVYYSKNQKSQYDDDDIWLRHYHSSEQQDTNIYIPVPFSEGSNQEYYQVGVDFAGAPLRSQIIKYIPVNDTDVPPPTPRIQDIDSLIVTPSLEKDGDPEKVQFDIKWSAPTNTAELDLLDTMLADGGKIYYELYINQQPNESTNQPFEMIKVFEVSLDGSGDIQIVEMGTTLPSSSPIDNSDFELGYNEEDEQFGMENVVLRADDAWANVLTEDELAATYGFNEGSAYDFEFPGVYYLRMKAVYVKDGNKGYSEKSIPVSISLDTISYEIPVPSNLDYEVTLNSNPTLLNEFEFQWEAIDIETYENFMLLPLDLKTDNIVYKWYLSEDKEALYNIVDGSEEGLTEIPATYINMIDDSQVYFDSDDLADLRDGQVFYSEVTTSPSDLSEMSFYVRNLDENQTYYMRLKAELQISDIVTGDTQIKESDYSGVLTVVTARNPDDSEDDEVLPLAPEELEVSFIDDSQTEALVEWTYPEELRFEEGGQGFEIIVLKDRSLPDDLESKTLNLNEIIDELDEMEEDYQIYRLYRDTAQDEYVLQAYDDLVGAYVAVDQIVEIIDNRVRIRDENLVSNTIYYYHVRTVNLEGNTELASNWVIDTLTTPPIAPPINLMIPSPSPYSYDEKTETVIRFDAPIPNNGTLHTDFEIEVFVKGEDDLDYTEDVYGYDYLGSESTANDGYLRMYYLVEDLRPGKSYSIKVRIEDLTKEPEILPDGTIAYPKSSFSERVRTRTDFDQLDNDKEEKYKEYIEYYEEQVEKLKEEDYWLIDDEDDTLSVKYKAEMMVNKSISGQTYNLVVSEQEHLMYYLPDDMLDSFNSRSITLWATTQVEQLGIRPNTISESFTKQLQAIEEEISEYETDAKDYYVLLEIRRGEYNGQVSGQLPATSLVDIQLKVVSSEATEEQLEVYIVSALDNVAEYNKVELIEELEEELETGINEERLNAIVKEIIDEVKADHQRDVSSLMEQYLQKQTEEIVSLNKPLYISWEIEPVDDVLSAYYRSGTTWINLGSSYGLGTYYINNSSTGSYILAANIDLANGYSQEEASLINLYGLNEFFTNEELQNPEMTPTKNQVMHVIARVMGADKTADPVQYLSSQGLRVNRLGMQNTLNVGDSYYLLLKAYEAQKNVDLSRVVISNYNKIKDKDQIRNEYQSTLLAGANLNLLPLEDGYLSPNRAVTLADIMKFLTEL